MRKSDKRILLSNNINLDKERLEYAKTIPTITVSDSIKEQNKMRSTDRALIRKRNRISKAEERQNKLLDKVRIKNLERLKCAKNLTERELKFFVKDWYKGIERSITAVIESQRLGGTSEILTYGNSSAEQANKKKKKKPATVVSRSDLSVLNPTREELIEDKELTFSTKGFYGTPLPLIPDIRKSEVSEGFVSNVLQLFGLQKKFERKVTLFQGPNKRANRYLVFHYRRMIEAIDGTIVKGNVNTPGHVVWTHNFYEFSDPNRKKQIKVPISPIKKAWNNYLLEMARWQILSRHMEYPKPVWKGHPLDDRKPTLKADRRDETPINNAYFRKIFKRKARVYWGIGMQLLRSSVAFRTALFKKTLGKKDRWFHRHFDIADLFQINRAYQEIADKFSSKIQIRRKWISTEQRDGSFKWRPLGISPYPWRIFTRGMNNLLETFLSGGWPANQHGYKTGRGVHTVWNQILHTVIKAKYIFEFDFTGFFNTVRLEAMAKTLDRFYVPKYLTAYLVAISSVDLENISKKDSKYLLTTKDPTKQGWFQSWFKYEYIHKYRKKYRSTGLPQGYALAPLLSVISTIVLDEIKSKGIHNILYCDDGLFYSDENKDFMGIAQEVLDKHGVGAYFNLNKSRLIKENGTWLSKLKFVGLEYDPFTDVMSASTRNGATLKLEVGGIGLFTNEANYNYELPKIVENLPIDWRETNDKLFDMYENIFIADGIPQDAKTHYYNEISEIIRPILTKRLSISEQELVHVINDSDGKVTLVDLFFPLRLLHNIDRTQFYEMAEIYRQSRDNIIPHDLIFDPFMNGNKFWMDTKLSSVDFESKMIKIIEEKRIKDPTNQLLRSGSIPEVVESKSSKVLEHLRWFHSLPSVPDSLKPYLNADGTCSLGEIFDIVSKELDNLQVPEDVANIIKEKDSKWVFTFVNWRNLYMDPAFATFIARLFQNTFRSGVVKQNFRLTTEKDNITLVKILDKFVGRNRWMEMEGVERFDTFNSSSFCANLLIKLINSWTPSVSNKKAIAWKEAYKTIKNRLTYRRTNSDSFEKNCYWEVNRTQKYKIQSKYLSNVTIPKRVQLIPLTLYATDEHKRTYKHLKSKLKNVTSFSIDTIARSMVSDHEIHSTMYRNPRASCIYPYKGSTW
jgi:hypothetical protein